MPDSSKDKDKAKTDLTTPAPQAFQPQKGIEIDGKVSAGKISLNYTVKADWMLLRSNDKAIAEMFYVYYRKSGSKGNRPVTFVFNGGPGAASVYLHVGAAGPKRVNFESKGKILPPPAELVDNESTWLQFSDLVFVDPIGTGFSRVIEEPGEKKEGPAADEKNFYQINRDLDSIGEFINRFLSQHHRWASPIFIAGESYGGFRVAKLTRTLQEKWGIGLSGSILISPALELNLLDGSDYDSLRWVDGFPSMAGAAYHHERCHPDLLKLDFPVFLKEAERFAVKELNLLLTCGGNLDREEQQSIARRADAFLGLKNFCGKRGGRLKLDTFCRELLRDQGQICGMYDASITAVDPFPDREMWQAADPTLAGIDRVFSVGINQLYREHYKLETNRQYHLLSFDVHNSWKSDLKKHVFESQIGATDDLRFGMALNPHTKVFITHGIFDLVTPYFASNRISGLMKLTPEQSENLLVKHFYGGHMFYSWEKSRKEFTQTMTGFYKLALPK